MKKPYLLTAGDGYYPCSGTDDWIACYETHEEAKAKVEIVGKSQYIINGGTCKKDWYEIIDLREWAE